MTFAFAALAVAPVRAQWTVTVLAPPGATYSECNRIRDGQQIGYVELGNGPEAALWSGSAASFVSLHPPGAILSQASSVQGGRQVGLSYPHAGYWSGTATSFVDLNPPGATESLASDIVGDTVVGRAKINFTVLASVWNLTSGTWTSYHPFGTPIPAGGSSISATDGVQHAGGATFLQGHAMVWNGSPTAFVDLHPVGATSSNANGVHLGQQVGRATYGTTDHAALWSGSASSFVDLQPAAASRSVASDVHQGQQVGTVTIGGSPHASLWSGSAASWVDLNNFLPPGGTASQAFGIWHDFGGTTYVVGVATIAGQSRAVIWAHDAPVWSYLGYAKPGTPGVSQLVGSGPLTVGSLASLALTNANPLSTSVLVIGVLPAYVPFLGGVLVPDPMLLAPLTTDVAGAVTWQVTVPGGLPLALPLRFQHWTEDPQVTFGYSASNGVLGILQ